MTEKLINCQNQSIPAYSGITINITNPTLNAAPLNQCCQDSVRGSYPSQPAVTVDSVGAESSDRVSSPQQYGVTGPIGQSNSVNAQSGITDSALLQNVETDSVKTVEASEIKDKLPQSYPPQYYLNNYNYVQNGNKDNPQTAVVSPNSGKPDSLNPDISGTDGLNAVQNEDMSVSQGIIDKLESKVQEEKELEKNGKQTRVIALTNEYIMSLEKYLNNPNKEMRLMASEEILTRLDEDKSRYDDAALNALLNKMLQDPEQIIRAAALSAFASQLASGNDYTVKLLNDIQNNPNANKEDVIQAANGLLKMSSSTEIRYVPVNNQNTVSDNQNQGFYPISPAEK